MKKVFKTIFIYLGVILLALIATIIFCAGFLFFYRDGNIFGIKYIKQNQLIYAMENEDMSALQTIEVNTDSFKVYVTVNEDVETLMGAMRSKVFGYAHKDKAQADFSLEYNEDINCAVFTSVQPKGWLNKKGSFINIAIPKSIADSGVNLIVKSNKGDIEVGGDLDLLIGNVTIENKKGDTVVKNIDFNGNLNIEIGSGSFVLDKTSTTSGENNIEISLGSGNVDFTKFDTSKFKINRVTVKELKSGQIRIAECEELNTDGNINGGGQVEIGMVCKVNFSSLDTNLIIYYINGTIENSEDLWPSEITSTGRGWIYIPTAKCNLVVNNENGATEIGTAMGTVNLVSNHGNIKMLNALKLVSASSVYGNIEIKFSKNAFNYSADTESGKLNRAVIAKTKNGHIVVDGLQNGNIEATGNGRITLNYDKVVGDGNVVIGKAGAIYIMVPNPISNEDNSCAFNLTLRSEVNSDIKIGVVGSIGETVDYVGKGETFTNIYNSGDYTDNNLEVNSTTGVIKIRSRDLVNY